MFVSVLVVVHWRLCLDVALLLPAMLRQRTVNVAVLLCVFLDV
jgi:hypothetical protein